MFIISDVEVQVGSIGSTERVRILMVHKSTLIAIGIEDYLPRLVCATYLDVLMNDALLEKVAQNHPELSSIYLSNCLLLTDVGIRSLLAHCPKLEKLYIDGIDEIRGTNWPPMAHLTHLNALNCPHLSGRWVTALPSLRILFLGSMSITDLDLIALPKLSALYLSHLYGISDQGLKPLLAIPTIDPS